jgi:hypothetical protein
LEEAISSNVLAESFFCRPLLQNIRVDAAGVTQFGGC